MSRMLGMSVLAHAVFLAAILFMPSRWLTPPPAQEDAPLMISLGGAQGPETGGLTQLSGRSVQALREPEAKPVPEPPPAAKPPEMVAPLPEAKPAPRTPPKPIEKPAERSATRKPTTGAEVKRGSARADTGAAPVPFGGLSSAGGADTSGARTDYANFCCPEYLRTLRDLIRRNWQRQQGASGTTDMKFVVRRDGTIVDIEVEKSSGQALLDQASHRALAQTRLPGLPREYPASTLTVYLSFTYQR